MKSRIVLIFLVLILLLMACGCTADYINDDALAEINEQLTEREKIEDFEYMYMILKENYPFFEVNKRLNGVDWLQNEDEYIEMVKSAKNDEEFYVILSDILKKLNNGHTNMISTKTYTYYKKLYKDLNMKPWVNQLENPKAIKRYLREEDSSDDSSDNSEQYIKANNVTTEIIEEGKIAYLSIKSFNSFNIAEDMKIIKPFLNDIRNFPVLIIDIRENGGGSTDYWMKQLVPMLINKALESNQYYVYRGGDFSEEFIKPLYKSGYNGLQPISDIYKDGLVNCPLELEDSFKYYYKRKFCIKPKDSVGFNGKIYLLVDRGVYSASEAFVVFAKSTGLATLVGERTGGDGIGNDPLLCVLPNSGYMFRFPCCMGLTCDGTCNEEFKTAPDIEVYAKKAASSSYDFAIQKVRELEKLEGIIKIN